MSIHAVPAEASPLVGELCHRYLRPPVDTLDDGSVVFDPDLTTEELATFDAILDLAASALPMTPATYSAVRSEMQTLRALRQMGRNAFMQLSAAERDRMIYDALTSQTIIDLAMLRDPEAPGAASARSGPTSTPLPGKKPPQAGRA